MATLDIRTDLAPVVDTIRFSNDEAIMDNGPYIDFYQYAVHKITITKSDIPNLVAALNKAKELGWY